MELIAARHSQQDSERWGKVFIVIISFESRAKLMLHVMVRLRGCVGEGREKGAFAKIPSK